MWQLRFLPTCLMSCAALSGCVSSSIDRPYVSDQLQQRVGTGLAAQSSVTFALPPGVQLDDGLTEAEAVAIALWNNAQLQVAMTQLGLARADFTGAAALPNPVLALLFPPSPARYEATLSWPIDLLSRHSRVNAAAEEVERMAARLIAQGLDLARDVRIAHAEVVMAQTQQRLSVEQAALSADIAGIAAVQFETGKISEQAYAAQRASSAELALQTATAQQNVVTQGSRLNELLGLDDASIAQQMPCIASALPTVPAPSQSSLLTTALQSRPELRADEAALKAAGYKAKWERNRLLNFIAQLKVEQSDTERSVSPGAQIELPLFNQNQAGRGRASAELERATQSLKATGHAIRREVGAAHAAYVSAQQAHALLRDSLLPALDSELSIAREAFTVGKNSYQQVAQVQLRYLQTESRTLNAQLDLQRAAAQLEHSLGQPLTPSLVATAAGATSP